MRRKIGRTVVKWALFVSRWPIRRINLQKILVFLFFLGPPGSFFWFFRWVILQMVVKTAVFTPRRTYALRKTFWKNFRLIISDYEGYFLKLPLRYLMFGCQKYSLRVQRITLRKVMFFLRVFQICFWTLSDNRPDLWRKVSAALPKLHSTCPKNFSIFCKILSCFVWLRLRATKNLSSEEKVSSVLSKLHSKRPRTFWWIFFQKAFFQFGI